jgi:hypothetical protein
MKLRERLSRMIGRAPVRRGKETTVQREEPLPIWMRDDYDPNPNGYVIYPNGPVGDEPNPSWYARETEEMPEHSEWLERWRRRAFVYDPESERYVPRVDAPDAPWDIRLGGRLQRLWCRLTRRPMPPYLQPGWEPKAVGDPHGE